MYIIQFFLTWILLINQDSAGKKLWTTQSVSFGAVLIKFIFNWYITKNIRPLSVKKLVWVLYVKFKWKKNRRGKYHELNHCHRHVGGCGYCWRVCQLNSMTWFQATTCSFRHVWIETVFMVSVLKTPVHELQSIEMNLIVTTNDISVN